MTDKRSERARELLAKEILKAGPSYAMLSSHDAYQNASIKAMLAFAEEERVAQQERDAGIAEKIGALQSAQLYTLAATGNYIAETIRSQPLTQGDGE